jgi:hypothetical protein
MALEREMEAYRRELPRLLEEGEQGRFALVHGDMVISIWDTRRDAVQAGHERFGLTPFLVQEVQREERRVVIPLLLVPHAPPNPAPSSRRASD